MQLRVVKRRICFGKHKTMKRAAEKVAKIRICFGREEYALGSTKDEACS